MHRSGAFLILVAMTLSGACQRTDSDVRMAALLIGANNALNNSSLSTASNDGLGGAVSAMSSASSGISTGTAFFDPFLYMKKDPQSRQLLQQSLLALAREYKSKSHPPVRPAAFVCKDVVGGGQGACDTIISTGLGLGRDEYILLDKIAAPASQQNCGFDPMAGSIEAKNVEITVTDLGDLYKNSLEGKFIYTKCRNFGLDYNDLPNFIVRGLNGALFVDGTVKSTLSEGSASIGGLIVANSTLRASPEDKFSTAVKDGSSIRITKVAMNMEISQTMSLNLLFDSDGNIETGLASGVVYLEGTINGESVNKRVTFAEDLSDLNADDDLESAPFE